MKKTPIPVAVAKGKKPKKVSKPVKKAATVKY